MDHDQYLHALVTGKWPEGARPAVTFTPLGLARDPECSEYMHRTGIAPPKMQVAFTFEPSGETYPCSGPQVPYQQQFGLSVLPAPTVPMEAFGRSRRSNGEPTELDIALEFIKRTILRRKGTTIYHYAGGVYTALGKNELQTLLMTVMKDLIAISGRAQLLNAIPDFLVAFEDILVGPDDAPGPRVCVGNGVLNLDDMQLECFSPNHFLTWKLNAQWDQSAVCGYFDQFLLQITGGNSTLLCRMWEALGYILFAPGNVGKCFFLLYGPSNTGKSVFGRVIESFFDDTKISALSLHELGNRFALSALVGKCVNLCLDLGDGIIPSEALAEIKKISGRDSVNVEKKYGDLYMDRLGVKLIFGSNFPVRIGSEDPAFYRRMVVLPFRFPVAPENQISNLDELLIQEKNGILRHAAYAYRNLKQRGYRFVPLPDDVQISSQYVSIEETEAELLQAFVGARILSAPGNAISTAMLFDSYRQFCTAHQHCCSTDKQAFSRHIRPLLEQTYQAQLTKRRLNGVPTNVYLNIGVVDSDIGSFNL